MPAPIILAALLILTVPSWAAEGEVFPDLDINNPSALQEGSRVLEEELKLAARPQTYLLVDLVTGSILIKARGVDLHRDRKSTRLNSSHMSESRMPSSA